MPAAETAQQKALALLGAETLTRTLDESPEILKSKSSLLIAAWDTMGWICFREGKLDQALNYVQAAWNNRQNEEVGRHVGDIRAAKGDRDGAALAYQQAKEQKDAEADGKDAKTTKASATDSDKIPEQVLLLGPAAGRILDAEVKVLFSRDGLLRAEPIVADKGTEGVALLKSMQPARYFPSDSKAHLVRSGYLSCDAKTCELIFEQ